MPDLIVANGGIPEGVIDSLLASVVPSESRSWEGLLALPEEHPGLAYLDEVIRATISPQFRDPIPDHVDCGIMQLRDGEVLPPRRDANHVEGRNGYRRRIGIWLFLNDPDGGEFELWDEGGPVRIVTPARNRRVLYDVNDYYAFAAPRGSRLLAMHLHLGSKVRKDEPPARTRVELRP